MTITELALNNYHPPTLITIQAQTFEEKTKTNRITTTSSIVL